MPREHSEENHIKIQQNTANCNLPFLVNRQYQGISVHRWRRDFFVSQAKSPQEYFVYCKGLRRRMAEKDPVSCVLQIAWCCRKIS